eukprot:10267082-Alexandrium_andersonii.AAC.1
MVAQSKCGPLAFRIEPVGVAVLSARGDSSKKSAMVEPEERVRSRSRGAAGSAGVQQSRSFAVNSWPEEVAREELWLLLAVGASSRAVDQWRHEREVSRALLRGWLAYADLR